MAGKPRWDTWNLSSDTHGPQPHIIGCYMILEYVGYERREDPEKPGRHAYQVRCLKCGREYKRYQQSIAKAKDLYTAGCLRCSVKKKNKNRLENKRDETYARLRDRNEFAQMMQFWPIVEAKERLDNLFDTERLKVFS